VYDFFGDFSKWVRFDPGQQTWSTKSLDGL